MNEPAKSNKVAASRKRELAKIAYQSIATHGLEGFRIRQVASAAGIDNGTLHYYFPSKTDLVRGVVDYLLEDLKTSWAGGTAAVPGTALAQLRREFEDFEVRLQQNPGQWIVLTELFVHARRNPEIAEALRPLRDGWRFHIMSILERGKAEGMFRADLDAPVTATSVMAEFHGILFEGLFVEALEADKIVADVRARLEHWLMQPERSGQ
jgi:AcrR family transcriptional regulator